MRIVSMLASATEVAYLLGLGDQVVGVSHECDYPDEVRSKPVVTRRPFDPNTLSSAEIDTIVSESAAEGRELYHIDADAVATLQPDLVLTQGLCEVCAVSVDAVSCSLPSGPRVLCLNGGTLEGVFADVQLVADAAGVGERGRRVVERLVARVESVRTRAQGLERKSAICLEWLDPLYNAGHWVPEMVELAGGRDLISTKGRPSVRVEWERVVEAQPEVIVLMPCGFGIERPLAEVPLLERLPGWAEIPAVRSGNVWAVDGSSYFSRSGPRLVDGLEIMATVLHPEIFGQPKKAIRAVRPPHPLGPEKRTAPGP